MEGEIVSVRDGMQSECKRKGICVLIEGVDGKSGTREGDCRRHADV